MAVVRYLTHPQVTIDPSVPVTDWGLSGEGHARVQALIARNPLVGTVAVISSGERKAIETADPIAAALGLTCRVVPEMHENDRSATGYLPGPAFEAMADRFFAHPDKSADGWETAVDAQARIVAATEAVLQQAPDGNVLLVGHGAVGTLLWCAMASRPISREHDQPGSGGGNVLVFDRKGLVPVRGWTSVEAF